MCVIPTLTCVPSTTATCLLPCEPHRIKSNYHTAASVSVAVGEQWHYTTQYCSCSWPKDKQAALTFLCPGLFQFYNSLHTHLPCWGRWEFPVSRWPRGNQSGRLPGPPDEHYRALIHRPARLTAAPLTAAQQYTPKSARSGRSLTFQTKIRFWIRHQKTSEATPNKMCTGWHSAISQQRPSIFDDATSHRQKLNIGWIIERAGKQRLLNVWSKCGNRWGAAGLKHEREFRHSSDQVRTGINVFMGSDGRNVGHV